MALNQRACLGCKQRKVRCDRRQPCCAGCLRTGQECHFPQSPIRRHRPKKARRADSGHVQHQGVGTTGEEPGCSLHVGPGGHKTRFLTASAWSRYLEKNSDIKHGDDGEDGREEGDEDESDHLQLFLFDHVEPLPTGQPHADSWVPSPSQLRNFWQLFMDNVDPVFKVVHKPSLHQMVLQAQTQPFHLLEAPCQTLLLSICCAAVHTLGPEQQHLLTDQPSHLKRISQRSVESALGRARLTQTNDMRVLQAFAIFLACVRPCGSRSTWTLVGLAIRISRALGLHCDGTRFNLGPLEVEMRRRLWWNLRVLDLRVSENCGMAAATTDFVDSDTRLPLNINDGDLTPEAETEAGAPPPSRQGLTEMGYSLLRFELCDLLTRCTPRPFLAVASKEPDLSGADKTRLARKICEKYIAMFTNAQHSPFYRMASKTASLVLSKFQLQMELGVAQLPEEPDTSTGGSQPTSQSSRRDLVRDEGSGCEKLSESVFRLSVVVVEDFARIMEDGEFSRWAWQMHRKPQLHAVSSILFELCAKVDALAQHGDGADGRLAMGIDSLPEGHRRAWDAIERLFRLHQDFGTGRGDAKPGMDRLLEKVRRQIQNKLAPNPTFTDEDMAEFSSWFDSELARHQNEPGIWDDFMGLDGIFNS